MARQFQCAGYTGPEVWDSHDTEWSRDLDTFSPDLAAESYAESEWQGSACEGDPTTKPTKIAVREPATGRRWIVTVHAEAVMQWTGYEEEVPTEGADRSAEEHEPPAAVR
jgi:hypothetical protein